MKYKVFLLVIIGFSLIISCQQSEEIKQKASAKEVKNPKINFIKTIPITGVVDLAFAKIDTIFNLYCEPYIKIGKNVYPIKGYHSINGSREKILGLSPNGRYFIMDSMSMNEAENNGCVVVDLLHKRVVHRMQSYCDGEWNAQDQWISDGQIILSFD